MKKILLVFIVLILAACSNRSSKHTVFAEKTLSMYDSAPKPTLLKIIEKESQKIPNDSVRIMILFKLANRYWNVAEISEYKRICDTLSHQLRFSNGVQKANLFLYLSDYYQNKDEFRSYRYLNDALRLFSKNADSVNIAKILNKRGSFLYDRGDYIGALASGRQSLRIAKNVRLAEEEIVATNLMGMAYREMREFDVAESHHRRAIKLVDSLNRKTSVYFPREIVNYNIALISIDKGDFVRAEEILSKLVGLQEIQGNHELFYAKILNALARVQLVTKSIARFDLLERAIEINSKSGNLQGVILNKITLYRLHMHSGSRKSASLNIQEAVQMARKRGLLYEEIQSLREICLQGNRKEDWIVLENRYDKLNITLLNAKEHYRSLDYNLESIRADLIKVRNSKSKWVYLSIITVFISVLLGIILYIKRLIYHRSLNRNEHEFTKKFYDLVNTQNEQLNLQLKKQRIVIAEELHDGVMNSLSAVRLKLVGISQANGFNHLIANGLNEIMRVEKSLRDISHDLDSFGETDEFVTMIEELVKDFKQIKRDIAVDFVLDDSIDWDTVGFDKKKNIYRIFQESIGNIIKHSNANKVSLKIENKSDISISISDNGTKRNSDGIKKGVGLKNIENRVKELDGYISITIDKQTGFNLIVVL